MSSAPPGFWGAAAGRGGAWVSAAGVWSAVGAFVAYAVRRELCVGGVMSRATRRRLVMRACRQSAGPPSRLARRAARKGGLGEARMAVLSLAVRQGGKADSKWRCSTGGSPPRQAAAGRVSARLGASNSVLWNRLLPRSLARSPAMTEVEPSLRTPPSETLQHTDCLVLQKATHPFREP